MADLRGVVGAGEESGSPVRGSTTPVRALRALLVLPLAFAAVVVGAGVAAPANAEVPGHGRHYEMVSPADKLGQGVFVKGVSPDGRVVHFNSQVGNGLPGTESALPYFNAYVSLRPGDRWDYFPMNLPSTMDTQATLNVDATVEQDTHLLLGAVDPVGGSPAVAFFVRRPGQAPQQVSPAIVNRGPAWVMRVARPSFVGSSADLSHVVFVGERSTGGAANEIAYLSSDPAPDGSGRSPRKLYESVAGDPVLRRVDVDDSGVPMGGSGCANPALHTTLGTVAAAGAQSERAVSTDGRRIFFTSSADCVRKLVYARVDGQSTVTVSASECTRVADPLAEPPVTECRARSGSDSYQSASADGRVVYFHSSSQLTNSDVDTTADLYRYDFDAPSGARLRKISGGTNATPSTGADLRGVVRISADGNRAYFVAGAVLTTAENAQNQTAVQGQANLYQYDAPSDSVSFVATLDAINDWAVVQLNDTNREAHLADPRGRYLVFSSTARLTADDVDNAKDIYRYDGDADQMRRVSTGNGGFGSDGNQEFAARVPFVSNHQARAAAPSEPRIVSEDGQRIVFATPEPLQADDTNGNWDVYEWADGDVGLISDGVSARGTADPATSGLGADRFGISADGSTVAFSTGARLLPDRDGDTSEDVYVARLGPDVAPLPVPAVPCDGDACQPKSEPLPGGLLAGSATFAGRGNVVNPSATAPAKVSLKKPRSARGSRATVTATVNGSGRLTVKGKGLKSSTRRVTKAGRYRVTVTLSARTRETLLERGTVRARVTVTFAPRTGAKASRKLSLTFKAASKKGRS